MVQNQTLRHCLELKINLKSIKTKLKNAIKNMVRHVAKFLTLHAIGRVHLELFRTP